MSEADEIQKIISDFRKGKGVSPEHTAAFLSWEGVDTIPEFKLTPPSSDYRELAAEYPAVIAGLKRCVLQPTIAILSAMLTLPELRSNSVRLEALVHLAIRYCRGKEPPTPAKISAWFNQLDHGTCGRMEDAAETPFVVNVTDSLANYAIISPQHEGDAYFTQVFLDILDSMPDTGPCTRLKQSCRAVLRLSELLVSRRELPRNIVGEIVPQAKIPQMSREAFEYLRSATFFSYSELRALGLRPSDLGPFTLPQSAVGEIDDCFFRRSPVEAAPLIGFPDGLVVVQPCAIPTAVRRSIIEFCLQFELKEAFEQQFVRTILSQFSGVRLFGDLPRARFPISEVDGVKFSEICIEADEGRYLQILFLFDDLDGYDVGGFAAISSKAVLGAIATQRIESAKATFAAKPNFREGLSVIVGSSWGRGMQIITPKNSSKWHVEPMAAYDLLTFSRLSDFTSLDLFRLIRARNEVEAAGIRIEYSGSLLNLYGWIDSLKGHIVRHEELSDEHFKAGHVMPMMIPTNCALKARVEVADGFDSHLSWAPDGRPSLLQRLNVSPGLGETELSPLYIDYDGFAEGKFRGAYDTVAGQFWVDVTTSPELDSGTRYHLQKMVLSWAELIAKQAIQTITFRKPPSLMWRVQFADSSIPEMASALEYPAPSIGISINRNAPIDQPEIRVEKGFLDLERHPDNIAEKTLVSQMVKSAAGALGVEENGGELESLLAIASDAGARHFHAFALSDVRDFVRDNLPDKGQIIEAMDDANGRLGLGWLARPRELGGEIEGLSDCRSYLSALVSAVASRTEVHLRGLDRKETVQALILNHEAVAAEMDGWKRTFKAVRSLSGNPDAAIKDIADRRARLNMASLSSRIAAEMALCACPLSGGLKPGKLDVAALMADAAELFYMGGFSDAMHAGAMKPEIHISPAGDVMMNHSFSDQIVQPMGEKFQAVSLASAADNYKANYVGEGDEPDDLPPPPHVLEPGFFEAFVDEFGFSIDNIRPFAEAISDLAAERGMPVVEFTRGSLVEYLVGKTGFNELTAAKMLAQYTLQPREEWKSVPEGILSNAWCPWRFKRQLSLLTRPIVQIDQSDDPVCLVAPAMVVHHLSHTLYSMRKASFDKEQFRQGGKMYRYVGTRNGSDGEAFNDYVAERVRELGWQAESNCSDGKILGTAKRPQFGDVDVFAWSVAQQRVIAVECKDLSFDKTMGEIARRLAKFRGETKPDGRRDDLKKHLDRVDILNAHLAEVGTFVGFQPKEIESVVLTRQPGPLQVDVTLKDKGVTAIAFTDLAAFLSIGGSESSLHEDA